MRRVFGDGLMKYIYIYIYRNIFNISKCRKTGSAQRSSAFVNKVTMT